MPKWEPGVLPALLRDIERHGRANQRKGLLLIAAAIEAAAKTKLGERSHARGTPSPAGRGEPPALVTGTGRRSIGHQQILGMHELTVRVGTLANVYPRGGSTPSSEYLMYQETLRRFDHAFLLPSFHEVVHGQVGIWLESFRTWPRI